MERHKTYMCIYAGNISGSIEDDWLFLEVWLWGNRQGEFYFPLYTPPYVQKAFFLQQASITYKIKQQRQHSMAVPSKRHKRWVTEAMKQVTRSKLRNFLDHLNWGQFFCLLESHRLLLTHLMHDTYHSKPAFPSPSLSSLLSFLPSSFLSSTDVDQDSVTGKAFSTVLWSSFGASSMAQHWRICLQCRRCTRDGFSPWVREIH